MGMGSRRRLGAAVAAALAAAVVVSVAGAARIADFRDEFTTLDTRRWTEITRPFGHGAVDAANVDVAGGFLRVKHPAGRLDGGELRSTALYKFGTYRARIKVADAPSSVTAFFLYKKPDYAQELDIEIFNDSRGKVMFTTYSGGGTSPTNRVTTDLGFDPTADFHEYAIEYDPGSVRFLVDGNPKQSWSNGVTRSSMYLYINGWFPSWLGGQQPETDRYTYVDWIEHNAR